MGVDGQGVDGHRAVVPRHVCRQQALVLVLLWVKWVRDEEKWGFGGGEEVEGSQHRLAANQGFVEPLSRL